MRGLATGCEAARRQPNTLRPTALLSQQITAAAVQLHNARQRHSKARMHMHAAHTPNSYLQALLHAAHGFAGLHIQADQICVLHKQLHAGEASEGGVQLL